MASSWFTRYLHRMGCFVIHFYRIKICYGHLMQSWVCELNGFYVDSGSESTSKSARNPCPSFPLLIWNPWYWKKKWHVTCEMTREICSDFMLGSWDMDEIEIGLICVLIHSENHHCKVKILSDFSHGFHVGFFHWKNQACAYTFRALMKMQKM